VDQVRAEDVLIPAEDVRYAEARGERVRPDVIDVAHTRQLHIVQLVEHGQMHDLGDRAHAHERDTQLFLVHRTVSVCVGARCGSMRAAPTRTPKYRTSLTSVYRASP